MDHLVAILNQLGADSTAFYQFGLFLLLYLALKAACLGKLQFVLETRENKTVKLEKQANEKFQRSERLMGEYQDKVTSIQAELSQSSREHRARILKAQEDTLARAQGDHEARMEEERAQFQRELQGRRADILKASGPLARDLLERIAS